MGRAGRSTTRIFSVVFVALLGLALGAPSVHARAHPAAIGQAAVAGGTICIDLEWAATPARPDAGFVVANRGNTVWRSVVLRVVDGRGTVCEAQLPTDRYVICEIAYGGYTIELLPAPGQTAYETCLGLTLGDGENTRVAFRNASTVPAVAPLPRLPNTGSGGMVAQP
jgi:hypothetical protein